MEKKNYTLIQNLMYYFNVILEIDSYSILKMCLYAIVQLLVSLVPLLISYFLVLWIENYTVTLSIIVRILLVFSIQGALMFIHLRLQINKTLNAIAVRIGEFGYRLSKHFFNLDYELLSQSKIYNAYTQALQNGINNNSSGSEAMYHQSMRFLTNALGLTFFMIIMTYHNHFVILISLISAVLTILSLKMRRDYREKHRNSWAKLDTQIHATKNDAIKPENGKDIRLYNIAPFYIRKIDAIIQERYEGVKKSSRIALISESISLIFRVIRDGYAYQYFIRDVFNGLSLSSFTLLFNIMNQLDHWLNELIDAYYLLSLSSQDLNDIRTFLEMENSQDGTLDIDPQEVLLEFKDVSYTYPQAPSPTLYQISLVLRPNTKLAIVGINGAGKTTLVKLMMGLIQPTTGTITINGLPLSSLSQSSRFKLFAPVFQDIDIWAFTLLENISLQSNADHERITQLLNAVGLGDKYSTLPKGLETPLTRNIEADGIDLSGGERQKLMLARSLYKNAPVLIMDEPTAALDALSEEKFYKDYVTFSKGKSSVFISHRLSSTRFCDEILLLDQGTIREMGTHESLMHKQGIYRKMYDTQSQYYQNEGDNL